MPQPTSSNHNASNKNKLPFVNILIVNKDSEIFRDISEILRGLNLKNSYHVTSAAKALEFIRQKALDLIVIDADIPDMDGWRLSRLVRSGILSCRADLPIIISAATSCERIAEVTAREYGVNGLLPTNQLNLLPQLLSNLSQQFMGGIPKPRLLVIEDEQDTADLVKRILGTHFAISHAGDGLKGLQLWKEERHDLVLLDVMLPSLSGRDILIQIQAESPHQPVVMMTAHTTGIQAEELMLLGAVDFLPKPFRAEQLRKVCDIAIHREDYLVSNAQFAARLTALEQREQEYKTLYQNHHQLLDDLQTVVMELDDRFSICYLNSSWEKLMGFSQEESLKRPLQQFIAPNHLVQYASFKTKVAAAIYEDLDCPDTELCLRDKFGRTLWAQFKVSRSTNPGTDAKFTVCIENITERRAHQEQLKYLAMHDSLTGLYNRHYFELKLEKLADEAKQQSAEHGLIYIDLDYFKVINDNFGHQRGDEVLREMSHLMQSSITASNTLCRLGGDEFAILLHNTNKLNLEQQAQHIHSVISEFTFQSHEQRLNLGCCLGLCMIDGSAAQAEEYLMRADIALYVAKGRGRNLIHFYNPDDTESHELHHRLSIVQKVRRAITDNRMVLYYQPIYDIKQCKISHFEALIRMREPDGSITAPGFFIPALEAAGEMHFLDRWIIKLAIRALKDHPSIEKIAINLSAQAFKNQNLVPTILEVLEETEVNPARITFELTESASLFNLQITQRVISGLHKLGCSFSVDDFGSGFSSFAYLKDLPADYIKLDGSFIQHLHQDAVDQTLVRSMIQVIQALGKKAVAEYVENAEILSILEEMGIDYVQGYHIGHPEPIETLINKKKIINL